jgi:hypothetical protein
VGKILDISTVRRVKSPRPLCVYEINIPKASISLNLTVILQVFLKYLNVVRNMRKKKERCELRSDLKGCALKHIGAARKLILKGEIEDADAELSYAEKHLKENTCT